MRLQVATQRTAQHGVKVQPFVPKILTQTQALLVTERTQLIVVGGPKRSLTMAHKVKISHAENLNQMPPAILSHERPGTRLSTTQPKAPRRE